MLCLFVSVPQRVISNTNDTGSSQMMEITEPSLPKLKQKSQPLHFILFSFPLLSFASFTLLHLISLASIYVNYIYKTPTMPVSFLTVFHNLLPYFHFRYTFLFLTTVTSLLAFHSSHLCRAIDTLFENRD